MTTVNISFLILCFLQLYSTKNLPSHFPRCNLTDPNINKCMLEATEKMKPYLAKGVPELNLPPFEPFYMPELSFEQGTPAINLKATLKDILMHGMTDYTFSKFEFDVPNLQFFGHAIFKGIKMEGKYDLHGKILAVPLDGSGTFNCTIDNCRTTVHQKTKLITRKGEKYLDISFTNTTMHIGKTRTQLNGLFGDNKELAEVTNKLINDNADELFGEIQPVLEQVMTNLLNDVILGAFIRQIPYDKLYLK
ncbi:unnamed protein product [Phaedon cochleariae]|uniref:Uncharacterized protein n=1 Tax=Phaedon cochleariae TaxID=80249 RepID=A0A9N9SFN6_PHACE|nr:unnamed protein product [Phaedon cochleariae]